MQRNPTVVKKSLILSMQTHNLDDYAHSFMTHTINVNVTPMTIEEEPHLRTSLKHISFTKGDGLLSQTNGTPQSTSRDQDSDRIGTKRTKKKSFPK